MSATGSLSLPDQSQATAAQTLGLGTQAATGACWTIIFSLLNKVVSLGSQVALGWLLWPHEFGLVAMAFAILGPLSLLTSSQVTAPLIASPADDFRERAGQVFWLSLSLNLVAAILLVCAAPIAASNYGEPRVKGLILLLAVAVPITALPVIYAARLYRELKFQHIAAIHFGQGLLQSGGAIALALLGFGASSLILPLMASGFFALICTRLAGGPLRLGWPQPQAWFGLLMPVGWLLAHSFFLAVQNSGPNFVLGLKQNPAQVGIYFWGYSLASQIGFVLATSLQNVVFPSLARLNHDPARQQQAIQNACRTLMMVIPPFGFLQMLLAQPLIQMCFHERWAPAITVVQWLSLTLITLPLSVVATSVCLARQEYRRLALLTGISALLTVLGAIVGSRTGDISNVSIWVSVALILSHLLYGFAGVYGSGTAFRNCAELLRFPLGLALPCAAAAWLICKLLPEMPPSTKVVLVITISGGGYWMLVQYFFPKRLMEITSRLPLNAFTRLRSPNLAGEGIV